MAELKAFKVNSLPGTLDAHALYFVLNGNFCETYLTDSAGVAKLVGNSSMITQVAGTGQQEVLLAADITARDALSLSANATVYVQDASADATVDSGGAFYFWDNAGTQWIKLAEFESMDVTINWSDITGAPSSTPAAIDQAVTDSHTHANKAILDGITSVGSGAIITAAERTSLSNIHTHANKTQLDNIGEVNGVAAYNGAEIKNWNTTDW